MDIVLTIVSLVGAVFWLPLSWRFFKNWQKRENPISLAIAGLTVFQSWGLCMAGWSVARGSDVNPKWAHAGFMFGSLLMCILFFVSFKWAERSFKEDRNK